MNEYKTKYFFKLNSHESKNRKEQKHMKTKQNTKTKIQQWLLSASAGLALICSTSLAVAQNLDVNTFDSGISGVDWSNFRTYIYGYTAVWDSSQDAHGNPNSGSMYLTLNWPLHSDPTWNESWNDVQIAFGTPTFDPTSYVKFDVDIKVDVTNSSPAIDGTSYGAVELIINNPWTTVVGWATLAVTNGWQHFSGSFSGISGTHSEAVIGLISNGGDSLTNTVSYWIDNIVFTALPTVFTNQPTLSLAKAPPPGLTCIASKPSGTYLSLIHISEPTR